MGAPRYPGPIASDAEHPQTAAELLTLAVRDLVRRIHDRVPAALADEPDAVHRLRTAVRRLRNVLAAFRRYLDQHETADLRARLKEWGTVLGRARDLEVRAGQAATAADDAGLTAAARAGLVDPLEAERREAHAAAVAWTRSDAGQEVARLLDVWADGPPLRDRASRSARKAARRAVRRQADRTLDAAGALTEPGEALTGPGGVHELRKAARRLRHTCDAITRAPVGLLGRRTKRLGSAGHRLQSLLGEHRDALLLAEHVRTRADGPAEYDAVVGRCQERALAALAELPPALADLADRAAERRT